MRIEELNDMDAAAAYAVLAPCADVPTWVDGLLAARPYADLPALLSTADRLAATWGRPELDHALADHPRIGERHAGGGTSATMSGTEQAGVDPADADTRSRLAAGNRAYEERFERIFLVRAAGRTSAEILDLLEQRLENDPDTEVAVAAGELREIALLRLRAVFG